MGTARAEAQDGVGMSEERGKKKKKSSSWLELVPKGESVVGEKVEGWAEARSQEALDDMVQRPGCNWRPLGCFKQGDHMISFKF